MVQGEARSSEDGSDLQQEDEQPIVIFNANQRQFMQAVKEKLQHSFSKGEATQVKHQPSDYTSSIDPKDYTIKNVLLWEPIKQFNLGLVACLADNPCCGTMKIKEWKNRIVFGRKDREVLMYCEYRCSKCRVQVTGTSERFIKAMNEKEKQQFPVELTLKSGITKEALTEAYGRFVENGLQSTVRYFIDLYSNKYLNQKVKYYTVVGEKFKHLNAHHREGTIPHGFHVAELKQTQKIAQMKKAGIESPTIGKLEEAKKILAKANSLIVEITGWGNGKIDHWKKENYLQKLLLQEH